jgi:hypothetical protein
MAKPLGGLNVDLAPVVACTVCGATTWMPLGTLPRGWANVGGQLRCNLHHDPDL